MSAVKVVFFDWGGVVADDPGDDFLRRIMRSAGVPEDKIHAVLASEMKDFMCGRVSNDEFWRRIEEASGVSVPAVMKDRYAEWPGLVANEQILQLVDELRAHGIKTAVLSNVFEPSYRMIKQAGYYDRFDAVFASCQLGYAKPDEEIYQKALLGMQRAPAEVVFIDDKSRSLEPARALGMTTILAQNPQQIIRDVQKIVAAA